MSAEKLPAALLKRKAVVYVRQSSQTQVQTNLESQRRQYNLVEVARRHGFVDIEVIDDDLGRSASGSVDRPGFERLVASVCAGDVGAVLCLDASRLSRNWRGFHHHASLRLAAYGFLVAERAAFSPSAEHARPRFHVPRVPKGYQPRGAACPRGTA